MDRNSPNAVRTRARRAAIELAAEVKALDERWRRMKRRALVGSVLASLLVGWVCMPIWPWIRTTRIKVLANGRPDPVQPTPPPSTPITP